MMDLLNAGQVVALYTSLNTVFWWFYYSASGQKKLRLCEPTSKSGQGIAMLSGWSSGGNTVANTVTLAGTVLVHQGERLTVSYWAA